MPVGDKKIRSALLPNVMAAYKKRLKLETDRWKDKVSEQIKAGCRPDTASRPTLRLIQLRAAESFLESRSAMKHEGDKPLYLSPGGKAIDIQVFLPIDIATQVMREAKEDGIAPGTLLYNALLLYANVFYFGDGDDKITVTPSVKS